MISSASNKRHLNTTTKCGEEFLAKQRLEPSQSLNLNVKRKNKQQKVIQMSDAQDKNQNELISWTRAPDLGTLCSYPGCHHRAVEMGIIPYSLRDFRLVLHLCWDHYQEVALKQKGGEK